MTESSLLAPDAPEAASPEDAPREPRRTPWHASRSGRVRRFLPLASAVLAGALAATGLLLPLLWLASLDRDREATVVWDEKAGASCCRVDDLAAVCPNSLAGPEHPER